MKKRMVMLLLTGVMCIGLLSGCGKSNADENGSSDGKSDDTEVLTMMLNGADSDAYVEGYRKIIDAFNADNEKL